VTTEVFDIFAAKMENLGFEVDYDRATSQLRIFTLPRIIFKKLGVDTGLKDLVNDLITSQLKECNCSNKAISVGRPANHGFSLLHVPTEIIDLFNMEACRGAIKFGDELTKKRCEEIIADLGKCQLPFQCAHGRPTVVPLTNLILTGRRKKTGKLNLRSLAGEEEAQ